MSAPATSLAFQGNHPAPPADRVAGGLVFGWVLLAIVFAGFVHVWSPSQGAAPQIQSAAMADVEVQ